MNVGIANPQWRGKRSWHPGSGACAIRNFTYLAWGPWHSFYEIHGIYLFIFIRAVLMTLSWLSRYRWNPTKYRLKWLISIHKKYNKHRLYIQWYIVNHAKYMWRHLIYLQNDSEIVPLWQHDRETFSTWEKSKGDWWIPDAKGSWCGDC